MKIPFLLCFFIVNFTFSQSTGLGFCPGSKGDPIFVEDFGSGTDFGPQLPADVTNYTYITDAPNDGYYTIFHQNEWFGWHKNKDHTPNDTNGKLLVINANEFTSGEFFSRTVSGLCENTSYEFTSWVINLLPADGCNNAGIPINVRFQILDPSDNKVLAYGDTGNVYGTVSPEWVQYGLTFTTPPGQTSVILKMLNNGKGGCGNDLGLDDIMFRSCGDLTTITDDNTGSEVYYSCEDQTPISLDLVATPDNSIYRTHTYQWQQSDDGILWNDIVGATLDRYSALGINSSTQYRVKVAEDAINLGNTLCSTVSSPYLVNVVAIPDPPEGNNVMVCSNETIPSLQVKADNDQTVDWYSQPTGGTPLQEDSLSFYTDIPGTYYAEARSIYTTCASTTRTPVSLTVNQAPIVPDQELWFCAESELGITAGIPNINYEWSTGETTEGITIYEAGSYSVTMTTAEGCSHTKTIVAHTYPVPLITKIKSNGDQIVLEVENENEGDFEYSINGMDYQTSTTFNGVRGGKYIIHAKNRNGCFAIDKEFDHLEIPKFFTPNGDGTNDELIFYGLENFPETQISIFDRYGKLIKQGSGPNFSWNGDFNGYTLPASDYWYSIQIEGSRPITGHISLKR